MTYALQLYLNRSHQQFVDDVTDAYIIGTFLDTINMEALSSVPTDLPPFSLLNDEQISNCLLKQVEVVMDCVQLNNFSSFNFLQMKCLNWTKMSHF